MPKVKKTTTEVKQEKATKTKKTIKATKAKKVVKKIRYWEGMGRRKSAMARVRLFTQGNKGFTINEKKLENYFAIPFLRKIVWAPLELLKLQDKFAITVKTNGGGINAQADAIRHGLSRALEKFNPNFRKKLKKFGYLTRDARMKERKKFGLKKARKAPQWSKR